jgi:uncharacterized protein YabE (DUF348 family)
MKRWVFPVLFLGLAAALFLVYSQGFEKTVLLEINGQSREIDTSAWTVSRFLEEQGIVLTEGDAVDPQVSGLLIGDQDISIQQASWFTIQNGGSNHSIFGRYTTLAELLSDLGIEPDPDDLYYLDGVRVSVEALINPGSNHSLQIQKQKSVELAQGNSSHTFHTNFPTLGASLWSNKIYLEAGDKLDLPLDFPITMSTDATLEKSQEITIQLSNETIKSKTNANTVGEALIDSGIALQDLDFSRPGANAPVPMNGNIQVIRVKEEQFLESEPIPFDTETQPVSDLEIDNRSLVQSGVLGLMTKRMRVRYEDGVETSRQIEDEYISQPPQAEIIGYGTKVVPHILDTPDGQIKYWRALEMYAVSYNVTSNGGYGTATGVPLAKGVAAIDPRYIAYGTRMYVPGYGNALAADTGGGIKGRMIDLGYLDEDYVSWHQWVTVYFLWPPPENIAWIIP